MFMAKNPADVFREPLTRPRRRALSELLAACSAAYHDTSAIPLQDRWTAESTFFAELNDHGVVFQGEGWIVVAVAGTDNAADWRGNLDYAPAPLGPYESRVAGGFGDAFRAMWGGLDDLLRALWPAFGTRQEGLQNNPPLVTFTGHSRGGALAQLLALEFWASRSTHCQCVTFGSPRVFSGGQYLPADWQQTLWRVEHSNDIVPHTPPCWRFRHRGTRVFLDEDGTLLENPSWLQLVRRKLRGYCFDTVRDHLLGNYRLSLEQRDDD